MKRIKPGTVKEVHTFKTTDGTLFENRFEAEEYQRLHDFRYWCEQNICRGGEWSADMVADEILAHWKVEPK